MNNLNMLSQFSFFFVNCFLHIEQGYLIFFTSEYEVYDFFVLFLDTHID